MKKGKNTENAAAAVEVFAREVAEKLSLTLWDVTFEKVGSQWELTVYIDKQGGVSMNDCEAVSRALDPILDREDPISESYTFYVSSAGTERRLTKPRHFEEYIGRAVNVKLYAPKNGRKEFSGILKSYSAERIVLECEGMAETVEVKDIARANAVDEKI